jgi:hypothetical protein
MQHAFPTQNLWLCAGSSSVPWETLLYFRQLLADIEAQGRMEHHHFAHALQASQASDAISAVINKQELQRSQLDARYPPPLSAVMSWSEAGLQDVSSQLDCSIATVNTRWTMVSKS